MVDAFTDRLAAEVRARRGALRLTQHDLAQLAGVSERFVRFVEQGKRSVQLDSLLALLETLGLELQLATRTRTAARAIGGQSAVGGMSGVPASRDHKPAPAAVKGPAPTEHQP
ncbi:type II toxin-antitoxin system Y4mF family antitoxin [Arthrobacter sp. B10-11]|uniref:type II toxin-antitoxin system Y4mF family antitoxin n=1 Tax=Arthrobacter sp. B10-11 TaxID=3081160 RepID=UPI0029544178|nr:type II toxin-antitoxin system Y4mF family antitoxin [Arthrobacter sp. B10-11]MDV8149881.1 type II toxin-antitoxin system Y4mF family antitoxin [Arthrobacter sp. B10-11]